MASTSINTIQSTDWTASERCVITNSIQHNSRERVIRQMAENRKMDYEKSIYY